ncbi:MAG: sugar transferase [Hyphomicrobiaceae bacterium]
MIKRAFDITAAAFGLVVALPVMAALIWLIRRDSDGDAIFSQVRVGRDARPFVCYKLRTMRAGTADAPTHEVAAAQITRIGRVLRATKLDELPQLYNVLIGDMSLVGPRPCLPSQTLLVAERSARGVLRVRPGITGLAQIRDIDMSDPHRLAEVDAEYCRDQSFLGDLRILFATFAGRGINADRIRDAAS